MLCISVHVRIVSARSMCVCDHDCPACGASRGRMSKMLKWWQKQAKPHKLTKSPCLLYVHMLYLGEVIVNRKKCCAKLAKLRCYVAWYHSESLLNTFSTLFLASNNPEKSVSNVNTKSYMCALTWQITLWLKSCFSSGCIEARGSKM